MVMGCPAKGYKLTPGRIEILRALAIHGPFVDPHGRAVGQLLAHTSFRRGQSLSTALEGLEAVGLVRRHTHSQRTYRIEAVLDRLTPTDRIILDLPADLPASGGVPGKRVGVYLTRSRVEVLRALLVDGPIRDPRGHATRILMDRLGRSDFASVHAMLTAMARAGLIRRTVVRGRVVGLEATIDGLSADEQRRIWSKREFPVAAQAPTSQSGRMTRTPESTVTTVDFELPVEDAEVASLKAELSTTRAELGRLRLQLEMFRAWANRMPNIDSPPPTSRSAAGPDKTLSDQGHSILSVVEMAPAAD